MSYIIQDNQLVAETDEFIKSGTKVTFTYNANDKTKEAKISNAKKWELYALHNHVSTAYIPKNFIVTLYNNPGID